MINLLGPFLKTFSICNYCYKKIPAKVEGYQEGGPVFLNKHCDYCTDDDQVAVLEKNPQLFNLMMSTPYQNIHGNMCNIAITDECNTICNACYCKIRKREKSLDEVMGLAYSLPKWINKIMLTGGEPTCHSKFFQIVSMLNCGVITNGINFADIKFLTEFANHNVYMDGTNNEIACMFSLNTKDSLDYDAKLQAIENFRILGLKIALVSATIADLKEIPGVIEEFRKISDVASAFKIRSAFNIGESHGYQQIYISDLLNEVMKCFKIVRFVPGLHNNYYLMNFRCDHMHIMLVKCPDKTMIDLCNIGGTGPYQLTDFNTLEDVVVALIINEGIEKGYFNGIKLLKQ